MKNLAIIVAAITLSLVMAVTPGCALISDQRQNLVTMEQADFAKLLTDVDGLAIKAGEALKGRLDPSQVMAAEKAVKFIFEQSNQERGKLLETFVENEKYKPLVAPMVGAILDLIEAGIGTRLELQSLGLTDRESQVLETILSGMLTGIKQ